MSPWTVFADGGCVRVCVSVRDTLLVQVLCASAQVCVPVCRCVSPCTDVCRCVCLWICMQVDVCL